MFDNPFSMVVAIVFIVMAANVLRARYKAKAGIVEDEDGNERLANDADTVRMREEMKQLKERIAVLERLATDDNRARELDRQIERLR